MATHAYIFIQENKVIEASRACRNASEALALELATNGGFIDKNNRDAWNTMLVNAMDAGRRVNELIVALDKAL